MSNPRPNSEMQPEAPAPRAQADWGQWGRRATATAQGIVVVATFVLGTIAALQTQEGDAQLADPGRAAFITFYCGGIRAFLSLYPAGRDRLPWSLPALLAAPAGAWVFMHPDLYRQILPDPFVGIPPGPATWAAFGFSTVLFIGVTLQDLLTMRGQPKPEAGR